MREKRVDRMKTKTQRTTREGMFLPQNALTHCQTLQDRINDRQKVAIKKISVVLI